MYRSAIVASRLMFAVQGLRVTVDGAEHVPRDGGAVLAANHIGYLDFIFAGLAARPAGRLVRFMAKQEVFAHPVAGPLMRGMRHIPVDRTAGAASFRAAVRALRDGEMVGVFPEATISRSFELKEFKSGTVQMAAAAGVPIVPVAIWGSQRLWTKDHPKRLGRSGVPIALRAGPPIEVGRREVELAGERLRAELTALLHAAQQGYPPLPPSEAAFCPARLGGRAPSPAEAARLDEAEAERRAAR
ncbi:MAG TPA: lysophospholipid acyltransferase family protein [Jatrophihabitans sp.]|nr:lysophospholipid acyltransferase family protein [Jatrophihabitans sp.]